MSKQNYGIDGDQREAIQFSINTLTNRLHLAVGDLQLNEAHLNWFKKNNENGKNNSNIEHYENKVVKSNQNVDHITKHIESLRSLL
jgi:hypothetical protein